jgi:hypothetical protein
VITDVVSIGPYTGLGGSWWPISHTADDIHARFNDAIAAIKSGMSANDGAPIYIYPSSTGSYTFEGYATADIPVSIYWPTGTVATFTASDNKMFRFRPDSGFTPAGSAIYGLRANAAFALDGSTFVLIDDNGVDGGCSNITLRDCWFSASAHTSTTTLENAAMVLANGQARAYQGLYAQTSGITVDNCKFKFGWGPETSPTVYGQTDAWKSDTDTAEKTDTDTVYEMDDTDNSLKRSSGSFITDGLSATEDIGRWIKTSGFTTAANNDNFRIVSVAATKIVLSDGEVVTEAAGDTVTWTRTEVTPKPYGVQGLRLENIAFASVTNNVFCAQDDTSINKTYGQTGGALTLDNCPWSTITGNRAVNLSTAAKQQGSNSLEWQYASDIFSQIQNAPTEGAHSIWQGNYVENVVCRYGYNVDDGKYDIVLGNGAGRHYTKCRAAFRLSGFDEILAYGNPHNINHVVSDTFWLGQHVRYDGATNTLSGPFNFGVGNLAKGRKLYASTSGANVTHVGEDAVSPSFVDK